MKLKKKGLKIGQKKQLESTRVNQVNQLNL